MSIVCAPRLLMCVGEPPPTIASLRRGNLGPVFVHWLRRMNIATMPDHAMRSYTNTALRPDEPLEVITRCSPR
jgi:hypothetical protein